jgi:hypothetical protein
MGAVQRCGGRLKGFLLPGGTSRPSLSPNASTVPSRSPFGEQGLPKLSLFSPVYDPRQRLELTQVNRVAAPLGARQEQERFLNIGGQQEQVEDLRHASTRHVPELGQRGIVDKHPGLEQRLAAERQGQQARHPRHAADRHGRRRRQPGGRPLRAAGPTGRLQRQWADEGPWYGPASACTADLGIKRWPRFSPYRRRPQPNACRRD